MKVARPYEIGIEVSEETLKRYRAYFRSDRSSGSQFLCESFRG